MHQLNRIGGSPYKLVKLMVINDQRGCNFKNHKIVSTDLGQDAVVPEEPHHQDLAEHARVDLQKCLEGDAQAQFPRSGEFNSAHQANAPNILDHFVLRKDIAQTAAEVMSGCRGALTQPLAL